MRFRETISAKSSKLSLEKRQASKFLTIQIPTEDCPQIAADYFVRGIRDHLLLLFRGSMVSVAQLVELWIVAPAAAGSNPVAHPTLFPVQHSHK